MQVSQLRSMPCTRIYIAYQYFQGYSAGGEIGGSIPPKRNMNIIINTRKYMQYRAETLALRTKPLCFPNMKY